ncbi:MAG TPA: hypothetical protein VFN49_09935 [Candidatus Aquilonibacter sp.]|nr:hypothetical protein [Candidatus Aquilonibacter sp.]
MKLFLGIPTGGAPAQPFLDSIGRLELPASITAIERAIVTGNYVPAQRELIVRRAIEAGADLLLMCDDDMIVPVNAVDALWNVLDRDPQCALAGALYYSRDGFRPMAVDDWDPDNTTTAVIPAFDHDPVAVAGVGFGCVLVRVCALASLVPPYFSAQVYIENEASRVRICNEDYLFCHRLRAAGFVVTLHGGVRCGHYDRWSGNIFPQHWETPDETTRRRMAVLQNGERRLVPVGSAHPANERHERVEISYIWSG